VGFAYKENRVWGIFGGFSKSKSPNGSVESSETYGGGAFLRQYKPLGKEFYFFAEETASFWFSKQRGSISAPYYISYDMYNTGVGVNPGLAYGVSRKFQLELSLNNLVAINYSSRKGKTEYQGTTVPETKETSFGIQSGLSGLGQLGYLNIGAKFIIGKS
jgi:hypothetical protein